MPESRRRYRGRARDRARRRRRSPRTRPCAVDRREPEAPRPPARPPRAAAPGAEAAKRAKEQAARRATKEPVAEREHGPIRSFFSSVIKELRKVQWPDRDTLVQASAVTLLFVAIAAAYLGVLDAIFSRLIDLLI